MVGTLLDAGKSFYNLHQFVAPLVATAFALFGCTSESADSEQRDAAIDASTPGLLGGATCASCLDTHCALENNACDSDPDCRTLRACRSTCATAECDNACLSDLPESSVAVAILASLSDCGAFRCGGECGRAPASNDVVQECTDRYNENLPELIPSCAASRDCACRECATDWLACFDDPLCATAVLCPTMTGCIWPYECFTICRTGGAIFDLAYRAVACAAQRCEPCDLTIDAGAP